MPERVRSMEGLGTSFFGLKLNATYVLEHEVIGSAAGDDHDVAKYEIHDWEKRKEEEWWPRVFGAHGGRKEHERHDKNE